MKLIEVIADAANTDTVFAIAEQQEAQYFCFESQDQKGRQATHLLASDDKVQVILDDLQRIIGSDPDARIHVLPVEVALPKSADEDRKKEDAALAAREALYASTEKSARIDLNYVVLVALSTVVAAIGLVENNVAVVIGAMVTAPLLDPNLAFGLATILGALWPFPVLSSELLARTEVNLSSAALALASGAAAFTLTHYRPFQRSCGCHGRGCAVAADRGLWSIAGAWSV